MDLEEVVLKAGSAYSNGKYEEALQLYQRAVLGYPHNAVLHANIAAILTRLETLCIKKLVSAERVFKLLVLENDVGGRIYGGAFQPTAVFCIYIEKNVKFNEKLSRYDEALQYAESAVNLEPKWGKASYRKGEALRQLGDHRAALLSFCAALRFEPPTKQCLHSLKDCARKAFPDFPLSEMEKLDLQDDSFALLATIGQNLVSAESYQEAIQILTWSLQLDSSCKTLKCSVLACLGSAHFKLDNPRKSINYYEQQLEICQELGTNEISALRNIATAAEAAHEWQLALRNRRKIFSHPNLSSDEKNDARQNIAELLLQMGRGEEAFFMLEMKPPENLRARINLACARATTGDGGSALCILYPLRPADEQLLARAMATVCRCFIEEGRLQEALNYLEEIMRHATVNGQKMVWKKACSLACRAHLRMGNVKLALQLAKRLLKIGRSQGEVETEAEALKLLSAAYDQQGDSQSAVALLRKCVGLVKTPVEKAKLHMEIALILRKDGQEESSKEHVGQAVEAADCTSDSQVQVEVFSSALRYYKAGGELVQAEELLQRQKDLLHYDLDGTTRSIIFEDMALMSAEEGGSASSVMALEHSLAEAQEANNIHRELELLEKMGDELGKLGKRREVEGFYQRFLALAKQLRIAEHIRRGHEKLAREYKTREDWNLCAEHARFALAIAKVQQDLQGRVQMFLLIGEAEIEKNDLETAIYVLIKAVKLAQSRSLQALGHFLLRVAYQKRGDTKMAEEEGKKFVSLCEKPSSVLCETLISLAEKAEPAEKVAYLAECRTVARRLKGPDKINQLLACFSSFLELDLIGEALRCLKGVDIQAGELNSLFELPLTKQLPVLLYLNGRKTGHDSYIHARLLLLGKDELCDVDPTCEFISAWKSKDWSKVDRLKNGPLDLSILSSDALELIEMTADWHLKKALPENLQQLSLQQQRYLHSFSWTHPGWSSFPCHRIFSQFTDDFFTSPELSPLEQIISGVLCSQTEMVPMWFEELLVTMRSSSFSPFPWNNPRLDISVVAAFVALAEEDPLCQIWILERAKWELDKHLLSCHGLPQPVQVSNLLFSQEFTYIFSLEEVELIWMKKEEKMELFIDNLTANPSFYVHVLSKFLRKQGVANLDPSLVSSGALVTNCRSNLPAERIVPWIRELPPGKRTSRSIFLLSISNLLLKGAVSTENRSVSETLKKFSDSVVLILDPKRVFSIHEILSAGSAPDVILVTGQLPFEYFSVFMLLGCSAIVEVENCSPVALQIFIEQLRMGDSVCSCASHLKHKLYGDPDFRIETEATLGQLRKIIREDPDSFLLLARSWRRETLPGESWASVAKGLITLSREQFDQLLSIMDDYSTEECNKMYNSAEVSPLQDPEIKYQWALLYNAMGTPRKANI